VATASGKDPGLRVSDADRDAVVTELGRHFQDGRLDQNEFDERIGAALSAKTEGDLAGQLTDLPRLDLPSTAQLAERASASLSGPTGRRYGRPPLIALLPIVFAVLVVTGVVGAGWHHGTGWAGWPFAPFGLLWLVIPFLAIRAWVRGSRRRPYQSEGGR
jgi:hypothetical protein